MRDVKMEADPNPAHIFFWWRVLDGIERKALTCPLSSRRPANAWKDLWGLEE